MTLRAWFFLKDIFRSFFNQLLSTKLPVIGCRFRPQKINKCLYETFIAWEEFMVKIVKCLWVSVRILS